MRKERDYKKDYVDYWKELIENEDGTLNKDQIMRELSDYLMIQENCTTVYMEMSNGKISKPNTEPFEVISEHNTYIDEEFIMKDDLRSLIDDADDEWIYITDVEDLLT